MEKICYFCISLCEDRSVGYLNCENEDITDEEIEVHFTNHKPDCPRFEVNPRMLEPFESFECFNEEQPKTKAFEDLKKRMKQRVKNQVIKISTSGNKGGDILDIVLRDNELLHIRSGHCCVMTIDKVVPVEFMTALLSKVMLENDNDIGKIIDSFDWSQEYKDELKKKVKSPYDF